MPTGITLDGDGNVWFSQKVGNKLGKFDPATEAFSEYQYVNEGGQPVDVQPEDVIYQPNGCGGYGSGGALYPVHQPLARIESASCCCLTHLFLTAFLRFSSM
ncbi:MAG: hypothetical protein R2873_35495 [Caldilineaceae bacterium]